MPDDSDSCPWCLAPSGEPCTPVEMDGDGGRDECVDCNHYVEVHGDDGCFNCGCTRSLFFDDDRGNE